MSETDKMVLCETCRKDLADEPYITPLYEYHCVPLNELTEEHLRYGVICNDCYQVAIEATEWF